MGSTKKLLSFFCLFTGSILLCVPSSLFAESPAYFEELSAEAKRKGLADTSVWHNLLHYQDRILFPGVRSLADDPSFFVASDGATNPASELEATLRSFFNEDTVEEGGQHPQCRFVARYYWLDSQLQFDSSRLKVVSCPQYEEWLADLKPQGITFIFPSAYLNNPASMFGHTLLRIDAEGQNEKTRLLAYVASYAASTDERNGIAFAIKGLTGFYPGMFAMDPYYKRVKMYTDMESRDIWEYPLDFSQEEVLRLLMHLWELGHTYFDYYFFDENCAYHLLSLLEFARPELKLSEQFRWWAIPSDTVRAVVETPDLVKEVHYRPSSGTILRKRLELMERDDQKIALKLSKGELGIDDPVFQKIPLERMARIFELSFEYLNYLNLKGEDPERRQVGLGLELLAARSRLEVPLEPIDVPMPDVRPEQGHGTSRISYGVGSEENRWFQEFRLRPAYHDLLDAEGGYTRGAQIEFFALTLRHYERDSVELHRFMPIDIVSLAPRNLFIKPISWKVGGGVLRKRIDGELGELVYQLRGGPGLSFEPTPSSLFYGFFESSFEYSPHYDDSNFAIGFGSSVGTYVDLAKCFRLGLSAKALRFGLGDDHSEYRLSSENSYFLNNRSALGLEFSREGEFGYYFTTALLSLKLYF